MSRKPDERTRFNLYPHDVTVRRGRAAWAYLRGALLIYVEPTETGGTASIAISWKRIRGWLKQHDKYRRKRKEREK